MCLYIFRRFKQIYKNKMCRWWVCSLLFLFPLVLGDAPSVFDPAGVVPLEKCEKCGNKNYYFSYKFKANYFHADQICRDMNMTLVTIPSKEVNDFLYTTVLSANGEINFWTSGTNLVDKVSWMWMSNAQPITYSNWNVGQPTASAYRCLLGQMIRGKDFLWMNVDCNGLYNFVCESIEPAASSKTGGSENWAKLFADPSVSPNFPLFNYNKKSYYVNTQAMSFLDANRFCRMINMELVSIESDAENTWVYRWLRNINLGTTYWSGGTNLINGFDWIWFSSGRKVVFTKWMKGQPATINQRCIQLIVNKGLGMEWVSLGCEVLLPFVCQSPTDKITRRPATVGPNGNSGSCEVKEVKEVKEVISPVVNTYHTYKVLTTPVHYKQAVAACEAAGMSLVSIQSKEKSDSVTSKLQKISQTGAFWTSGHKIDNKWFWLKGEPITFTNWNDGEPNNKRGNENCLTVFKSGTGSLWNDDPCDFKFIPVCEIAVTVQNEESREKIIASQNECCKAPVVNVFVDRDQDNYVE
ncbi:macrophage mannose receptor 1-like [Diabrotica virgifera virgifera]|uniref:Macrophage mannose receptor 1-like n=1 Tax=Diabrotica virgifera virgifera TaxID=50390 RepID=A0A6P7FYD7_DIAVI|nr:macrophage mannose receptor 1-like [Diabrotica virgifera virgifera]